MRVYQNLLIAIFFIICSFTTKANNSPIEEYELMKLHYDFAQIIVKTGEKFDQQFGTLTSFEQVNPDEAIGFIKKEIQEFSNLYQKHFNIPYEKMKFFQKIFDNIIWNKLYLMMRSSFLSVGHLVKKMGIGVSVAISLGGAFNYILPIALSGIGLPELIPVSVLIPWAGMFSFIPNQIEKFQLKQKLINVLGGKEKFQLYKAQLDLSYSHLKLKGEKEILLPLKSTNTSTLVMSIQSKQLTNNILQKMGYRKDVLNLQSIKVFIKENELQDKYILDIYKNPSLSDAVKTYLLSSHILDNPSENIQLDFQTKFSKNFVNIKNNMHSDELLEWTKKMYRINSVSSLKAQVFDFPTSGKTSEFFHIWDEILLSKYADKLNINYLEYRNLRSQIKILKAKYQASNDLFDEKIRNEFFTDIFESVSKKLPFCSNKQKKSVMNLMNLTF